jgi:hypothetical protein
MKKLLLIIIVLDLSFSSFSQEEKPLRKFRTSMEMSGFLGGTRSTILFCTHYNAMEMYNFNNNFALGLGLGVHINAFVGDIKIAPISIPFMLRTKVSLPAGGSKFFALADVGHTLIYLYANNNDPLLYKEFSSSWIFNFAIGVELFSKKRVSMYLMLGYEMFFIDYKGYVLDHNGYVDRYLSVENLRVDLPKLTIGIMF